jgi:hypothetical protein
VKEEEEEEPKQVNSSNKMLPKGKSKDPPSLLANVSSDMADPG